jgi:hypothetical protein
LGGVACRLGPVLADPSLSRCRGVSQSVCLRADPQGHGLCPPAFSETCGVIAHSFVDSLTSLPTAGVSLLAGMPPGPRRSRVSPSGKRPKFWPAERKWAWVEFTTRAIATRLDARATVPTFYIGTSMKAYALAALVSGLMVLSSAAMAQTLMQACGPDIQRYCSGVGRSHIKQCMKKHMQELSPVCVGTLVKMKQGMSH